MHNSRVPLSLLPSSPIPFLLRSFASNRLSTYVRLWYLLSLDPTNPRVTNHPNFYLLFQSFLLSDINLINAWSTNFPIAQYCTDNDWLECKIYPLLPLSCCQIKILVNAWSTVRTFILYVGMYLLHTTCTVHVLWRLKVKCVLWNENCSNHLWDNY